MPSLKLLIDQSALLIEEISKKLNKLLIADEFVRVDLACTLASISIEHSGSLKVLFAHDLNTSALAVFRCQFEALVRAFWIAYVATDQQVEMFSSELNLENVEKSEKLPMLSKMLEELEKAKCPAHSVVLQLQKFKSYSWKALNSYTHAGLHATSRNKNGFPTLLAETAIKQSNNLLLIALQMFIVFSITPEQQKIIPALANKYQNCLVLDHGKLFS